MATVQLSITVRPCVKEFITSEEKKRQLSISRYIESKIYNDEEDYVRPMAELDAIAEEEKRKIDDGTAKLYDNADDFLKDLHEEVSKINSVR